MKITSNSIENWSLEFMCKGCNSTLEIDASDVRCSLHRHDLVGKEYNFYVVCAVCDSKCSLKNLPKPVEVKARNKKKHPDELELIDVFDHGHDDEDVEPDGRRYWKR